MSLYTGQTYTIEWYDIADCTLQLSRDNGSIWESLSANIITDLSEGVNPTGYCSYDWVVDSPGTNVVSLIKFIDNSDASELIGDPFEIIFVMSGDVKAKSNVYSNMNQVNVVVGDVKAKSNINSESNQVNIINGDIKAKSNVYSTYNEINVVSGDIKSKSNIYSGTNQTFLINGDIKSKSNINGDINQVNIISGDIKSKSNINGDVNQVNIISGDIKSKSNINGDVTIIEVGTVIVNGAISSKSNISSNINQTFLINGDIKSKSNINGDVNQINIISDDIKSKSNINSESNQFNIISGDIKSKSNISSIIDSINYISGDIKSKLNITSDLNQTFNIVGEVIGKSKITSTSGRDYSIVGSIISKANISHTLTEKSENLNYLTYSPTSNNWFNFGSNNYNNDRKLLQSMQTEIYNRFGLDFEYYVTSYDKKYNAFFGEDINRRYVKNFEFKGFTRLQKEERFFSKFGIENLNNMSVWISKKHFRYVAGTINTIEVVPKIGDIVKMKFNNVYYEIVEVPKQNGNEYLQSNQFTWEIVLSKYKDEMIDTSEVPDSSISAVSNTGLDDIFDIKNDIDVKKDDVIYVPKTTEKPNNDPWSQW
jgi:hypothetical protein